LIELPRQQSKPAVIHYFDPSQITFFFNDVELKGMM